MWFHFLDLRESRTWCGSLESIIKGLGQVVNTQGPKGAGYGDLPGCWFRLVQGLGEVPIIRT